MYVKNLRPFDVEIPGAGVVEADGSIEVDDDVGKSLLEQEDAWGKSTAKAAKAAEATDEGDE